MKGIQISINFEEKEIIRLIFDAINQNIIQVAL